jgi:hypothetical protein
VTVDVHDAVQVEHQQVVALRKRLPAWVRH